MPTNGSIRQAGTGGAEAFLRSENTACQVHLDGSDDPSKILRLVSIQISMKAISPLIFRLRSLRFGTYKIIVTRNCLET